MVETLKGSNCKNNSYSYSSYALIVQPEIKVEAPLLSYILSNNRVRYAETSISSSGASFHLSESRVKLELTPVLDSLLGPQYLTVFSDHSLKGIEKCHAT
jgi:hypothetical protein